MHGLRPRGDILTRATSSSRYSGAPGGRRVVAVPARLQFLRRTPDSARPAAPQLRGDLGPAADMVGSAMETIVWCSGMVEAVMVSRTTSALGTHRRPSDEPVSSSARAHPASLAQERPIRRRLRRTSPATVAAAPAMARAGTAGPTGEESPECAGPLDGGEIEALVGGGDVSGASGLAPAVPADSLVSLSRPSTAVAVSCTISVPVSPASR